jgi:hypothetical protein
MREDLILQIIFNVAAHNDERLPNVIEEEAAQKGNQQNQKGVEKDPPRKHIKKRLLGRQVLKGPVNENIVNNQVDGIAHEGGRNDLKHIGDDHKKQPEQQVPFVLKKVFIEIEEFFHEGATGNVVETKVCDFGSFLGGLKIVQDY